MTDMVQVNTAEADGELLDWLVAKAVGYDLTPDGDYWLVQNGTESYGHVGKHFSPRSNWNQGGPFIGNYGVTFDLPFGWKDGKPQYFAISAMAPSIVWRMPGLDHLTAAMRAIVAAVLGDKPQAPKELTQCH